MPDTRPALIVCAHGTDDPDGRQVVADITAQVRAVCPDLQVHAAHVDVQQPRLAEVVDSLAGVEVVVVPLLLSYGYHVEVDVARAVAGHPRARAAGALGPDGSLADVVVHRLHEAAVPPDASVVLAVAGSSRERARDDAERAEALVNERWRGPVTLGFCSAAEPSVSAAVGQARAAGSSTVVVASYLVGPGYFHRLLAGADADVVTEPLGAHPAMADLVVRHGRALLGS